MEKNLKHEVNVTTGEVTLRDFTPEELAQAAADEAVSQERKAADEAKAIAKAALLAQLGIDEDQAKLLLS